MSNYRIQITHTNKTMHKEYVDYIIKKARDKNEIMKLLELNDIINLLNNKVNLYHIPEKLRTKEVCEVAFKNCEFSILDIPKELQTKQMCNIAVNKNCYLFTSVPDKFKTKELCEIVIKQDGSLLYLVPDNLRTEEMCNLAILTYPDAELYAPPGTSAYNNVIMKKALL